MKLHRDADYEVGWITWPRTPSEPVITVLAKVTWSLVHGDVCRRAREQPAITGDAHHDDDPDASLRAAVELVPFKPRAEVLVAGTCHPPGGAATVSAVAVRVGTWRKALAVFGDREWTLLSGPGKPEVFERMPLRWERSFGGPSFASNPFGRGLEPVETDRGPRRLLPNLELPDRLITSKSDRPAPAGFFPLLVNHPDRSGRARAVDRGQALARWPAHPAELDYHRYCAAPLDQRLDGYFRGDEEIVLTNLRPDRPELVTRLPAVRPRVLLERTGGTNDLRVELDTIWVDADAGTVSCLWRGVAVVRDVRATDVERVLVTDEPQATPRRSAQEIAASIEAAALAAERDDALADVASLDGAGADRRGRDAEPARARVPMTRDDVIARLAASARADLSWVDLAGTDLTGLDLSHALLDGARLDGAKLDGVPLEGAHLAGASLDGASLRGALLEAADLTGASLSGADLSNARLVDAVLDGASLGGARLDDAVLDRAELSCAVLSGASARRASLRDTTLDGAKLDRAVLDDADATYARVSDGADLTGASLARLRAHGAHFDGARMTDAHLGAADLTRADLRGANLDGATLAACTMRGAMLSQCSARRADLRRADLLDAHLDGADLREADLRGASLFAALTKGARLEGAKLEGADLGRTMLSGVR
ncbi:MAG: DUF2169 domain-containing protein [Deltaproteobacteria bacterium]|nr:DUF2169 domain-containing protein [Deltaproteobacteria bacterium]